MSFATDLAASLEKELEKIRQTGDDGEFCRLIHGNYEIAWEEGDQAVIAVCKAAEAAYDKAMKEWRDGHQAEIKAAETARKEQINALMWQKAYEESLDWAQYH